MNPVKKIFPTVRDYAEALANPSGRFASLDGICAVTDPDGGPEYVSGTGRVTFRVLLNGEPHALTCFTSSVSCSAAKGCYGRLVPNEVYVFNHEGQGDYYPVALRAVASAAAVGAEYISSGEDECGEIYEGRRLIVREGCFGFADEEGSIVVEPRYAWAGDFCEGRAAVAVSSVADGVLMGLIDWDGNAVIPAVYDDLSWDGSRYAYVDLNGRHGCLDRTGRIVVPLEYDGIGEFDKGFAVVWRDGLYGYVDEAGALVGEGLAYEEAWAVGADGMAQVLRPGHGLRETIRLF